MNIYDYISSKDLAKALQESNHIFTPLEKAYLIWSCTTNTMDNCQRALKELVDTTEDFKLPYSYNNFNYFKEYVNNKIETRRILIDAFNKESIQSVYYHMPIEYEVLFPKFYFATSEFRTFNDVFDKVLSCEEERFIIYKRDPNHPFGAEIECIFNREGEMQSISIDIDATYEKDDPLDFNSNWDFVPFIFKFPCPFKEGDRVKFINDYRSYIVTDVTPQYATDEEFNQAILEGYDNIQGNTRIKIMAADNPDEYEELEVPYIMLEKEDTDD